MIKIIFALASAGILLADEEVADKRLQNAADTLHEIMSAPDKAIPQKLLDKAECIIIVPGMKKAALGLGGVYGRGFVSCRSAANRWALQREFA